MYRGTIYNVDGIDVRTKMRVERVEILGIEIHVSMVFHVFRVFYWKLLEIYTRLGIFSSKFIEILQI